MPTPAPKDQWFAVQVLSGQEQKVHDNMVKRIKTEEISDLVFEVLVPTERVSEIKRGKRTETTRKLMPAAKSLAVGALPIGLAHRVKLKNDVAHGAEVRWSDVEIDTNNETIKTRRAMEAAFASKR